MQQVQEVASGHQNVYCSAEEKMILSIVIDRQQPTQIKSRRIAPFLTMLIFFIICSMFIAGLVVYNNNNNENQIGFRFVFEQKQQQDTKSTLTDPTETIAKTKTENMNHSRRRLVSGRNQKPRVLYIVTTLAEYNTGTRSTVRGSDRLQETTIPIISEGVNSMVETGYDVDLYLICHFVLQPEREALVRAALPAGVTLQVWNDATPLGYDTAKQPFRKLEYRTLHLARQHRFVIKDKLLEYDVFVNFEDDMLITGEHVNHYQKVSAELERLYNHAPETFPPTANINNPSDAFNKYYGPMTKGQLKRMLPGFIRVEVLYNEVEYGSQTNTGPVPVDMDFPDTIVKKVDSTICCNLSPKAVRPNRPAKPEPDQLMIWETNILPLGVRKMPDDSWLEWVLMQRGPKQDKLPMTDIIGDYWSNRNNMYWPRGTKRPAPQEFKYINNQGGWMATRNQLIRWHVDICPGGFLPPYEPPHYHYDGLDMRNVEWYSGGMQLSTIRHACNMQRIILLDPQHFSKSLLYHTANNKQQQLSSDKEEKFVKANTLLGQLNTIRKHGEQEIITAKAKSLKSSL